MTSPNTIQVIHRGKKNEVIVPNTTGLNYFGEQTREHHSQEYLFLDPLRSKLAAAILLGLNTVPGPKDIVLYLGASAGYTVSALANVSPLIFAVEIGSVMSRELVFLSENLKTVAPIYADASKPESYAHRICQVDYLFQDVSQKNQIPMFLDNIQWFLKKGGIGVLSLKTKNIDFMRKPADIFNDALETLSKQKDIKILQHMSIERYQKDHFIISIQRL